MSDEEMAKKAAWLTPNLGVLLDHVITEGVERGWRAAHDRDGSPSGDIIRDNIVDSVKSEIYEWFIVPDQYAD